MDTAKRLLPALLLGSFLLLSLLSVRRHTLTYDEPGHYQYGRQLLGGDATRFDDSKMPASALNALPAALASRLPAGALRQRLERVETGRVVTILFSLLVAWAVYHWSRRLFGFVPALFSLLLYVFDPNLIAHSQLITTDLYAAGMVLLACYSLWLYRQRRDLPHALLFAALLGLSQLAKYTCVFLYPLLGLALLFSDLPELFQAYARRRWDDLAARLRAYLGLALLVVLASLLILNLGFLFDETFTPLADYRFKSDLFQAAQARLAPFGSLPIPLPYPYLQGLDLVRYVERTGSNFSRVYLLGRLSETGFPGYYLVACLFKVPLATQVAVLAALGLWLKRVVKPNPRTTASPPSSLKGKRGIEIEAVSTSPPFPGREGGPGGLGPFLLLPVLFFTIYFNFFYRAQIGIRFYLVIFPLLYVFCGSLVAGWKQFGRSHRSAVALLALALAASSLSYFPHYLAYFNELVPDRRFAYTVLADSNLDWGQAGWYLERFLKEHPQARVDPGRPVAGLVVVGANNLVGITAKPHRFAWLRENFAPVGTVAYSYLIYEIPREALDAFR